MSILFSFVLTNSQKIPYNSNNQKFFFLKVLGGRSKVIKISSWRRDRTKSLARFEIIFINRCVCSLPILIDS